MLLLQHGTTMGFATRSGATQPGTNIEAPDGCTTFTGPAGGENGESGYRSNMSFEQCSKPLLVDVFLGDYTTQYIGDSNSPIGETPQTNQCNGMREESLAQDLPAGGTVLAETWGGCCNG